MKIFWRILLALLFLLFAILTGLYFEEILFIFVTTFKTGWVFSTIFIRLLIMILTYFAFREIFSIFYRTRKIRSWIVILAGAIIGFGIGFGFMPIYNSDYVDYADDTKMTNIEALYSHVSHIDDSQTKYRLAVFFTTTCPHCKATARKLGANIKAGQKVPIDIYFPSSQAAIDEFIINNDAIGVNTYSVTNTQLFAKVSHGYYPTLYLIDADKNTIKHWSGDQLSYFDLDELIDLEIE